MPPHNTYLALVLIGKLERLDESHSLGDAAAHLVVVDLDAANDALWVDYEQATAHAPASRSVSFPQSHRPLACCTALVPERGAIHVVLGVLHQHAVRATDLLADVRHKRDVHATQAAVHALGADPRQVGVVGVRADGDHFGVDVAELAGTVGKGNQLGGAHNCGGTHSKGLVAAPSNSAARVLVHVKSTAQP